MVSILDGLDSDAGKLETLSLAFSNLETACGKIGRPNQARLFKLLARSCHIRARKERENDSSRETGEVFLRELVTSLKALRTGDYEEGREAAGNSGERGVLRTMTWGQKVTGIQASLITRLLKKGPELIGPDDQIHVCSACGFLIVKGQTPDVCPICNAPTKQFVSF